MNSLNILSARVSPPQTPSPSRSNSYANISSSAAASGSRRHSGDLIANEKVEAPTLETEDLDDDGAIREETPLLDKEKGGYAAKVTPFTWLMIPKSISAAVIESVRWMLSTLAAPGVYLIACLYDERGNFAPLSQLSKLGTAFSANNRRASIGQASFEIPNDARTGNLNNGRTTYGRRGSARGARPLSSNYSSSGMSSGSESELERRIAGGSISASTGSSRHTRSKSLQPNDEIAPARRSIRIRLHNEDSLRQRKNHRVQTTVPQNSGPSVSAGDISPANIKSPTSPSSLLMTKYPRAPAPPRPLIPPRQPSFTDFSDGRIAQKTLVLDLDETLIHSMAKGGRMSTGHMVEVKLNTVVGAGANATFGPQHPILYYVHKRPHCDEFLRRVCKWYNLVVFTASVQEYADPVIDLLEVERKFFSARYYRQHCTIRNGAHIKDLSCVEPDLSKVMILDNSPLSYIFNTDNAIPIEGWINDPSDNDLLHLIPLLEGLQWVTDVRALLGLRGGEEGKN